MIKVVYSLREYNGTGGTNPAIGWIPADTMEEAEQIKRFLSQNNTYINIKIIGEAETNEYVIGDSE